MNSETKSVHIESLLIQSVKVRTQMTKEERGGNTNREYNGNNKIYQAGDTNLNYSPVKLKTRSFLRTTWPLTTRIYQKWCKKWFTSIVTNVKIYLFALNKSPMRLQRCKNSIEKKIQLNVCFSLTGHFVWDEIKTYISNLLQMMCVWNNLHQVRSNSKDVCLE